MSLPGPVIVVSDGAASAVRDALARADTPVVEALPGEAAATISMGVTASTEKRDRPASEFLREADLSLSAAKKKGRNRVEIFSAAAHAAGQS